MNVKFEKVETNVVKLEITVPAERFSEAVKKAFAKNSKKFNIPGFRKGKAPMAMVKKFYGEAAFYDDAINICIEETYPLALEQNNVTPVDYPQIDVAQIGEGKDLVYTAKITVMPEVELGQYKGVEIKNVEYNVTEEDIQNELKAIQEKNARVEVKTEGTVEKGDIATIDFKGYIDGVAFEGGEGKDYPLEIGSGSFIGDFEDQLVGTKVGEKVEVKVSFPENYGKEDLNGKPALFEVTVKEIKGKEMPALDDELAKETSEFDTLEELKADIKANLQESNELKAATEKETAVIDAVCLNAKVEIPEVMVNSEIDNMLKDLEMRLKYQGLDLKSYYQYTNSSEEKMREFMKDNAERKVRTGLVIDKIAAAEDIKATEEEIKEKATEIAKQYGEAEIEKTVEFLVQGQGHHIAKDVVNSKVLKMLVENSVVTA